MRVALYVPSRLYGFCEDEGGNQVFFHARVFQPGGAHDETPVPPLLGETVEVDYDPNVHGEDNAPRASLVRRLEVPVHLSGTVEQFNSDKGWGFVLGDDETSYYLHRSEVQDGKLPSAGRRVLFYAGRKKGRPRACYVRVEI